MFGEDSHFTSLSPDYSGIDPDDGFSTIPYEKGSRRPSSNGEWNGTPHQHFPKDLK